MRRWTAFAVHLLVVCLSSKYYSLAFGTLKITTREPMTPAVATTQSTTLLWMKKTIEMVTIVSINRITHTLVVLRIPPRLS